MPNSIAKIPSKRSAHPDTPTCVPNIQIKVITLITVGKIHQLIKIVIAPRFLQGLTRQTYSPDFLIVQYQAGRSNYRDIFYN